MVHRGRERPVWCGASTGGYPETYSIEEENLKAQGIEE